MITEDGAASGLHPTIVVALVNQGFKTARWIGASVAAIFAGATVVNVTAPADPSLVATAVVCIVVAIVGIVFAILGILYGRSQRAFRLSKVEYMAQRIQELEAMLDPARTSSGLTSTGETNPGDL